MEILITITAIKYDIDIEDLEPNQEIILRKEPTNKYDKEAIAVYLYDEYQIGYVANSVYTVAKGCYSAGRLYDKMKGETKATIFLVNQKEAYAKVIIE